MCFFFQKNYEKIKISRIKLEKMFIIAEFCAESFANIFRFLKALYPARSTFFVNKKTKITTFLLKNIHKLILLLKFLQIIFQHWQLIPIPVYEEHNRPVRKRFLDTIKNNISQDILSKRRLLENRTCLSLPPLAFLLISAIFEISIFRRKS